MKKLLLTDLGTAAAHRWPLLTQAMLQDGHPRWAVARLTGGVISLGRWQRGNTVLSSPSLSKAPVRRTGGGRALALGDGLWGVALTLPHRAWMVGETPHDLPMERFLNRAVRPLLAALHRLGVSAAYHGRDFITAHDGQAGYLSYDQTATGAVLLECVLPAGAHWWMPDEFIARPARPFGRGFPPPTMLPELERRTPHQLLLTLGEATERTGNITTASAELSSESVDAPHGPWESLTWSEPMPVPSGHLQVGLSLQNDRVTSVGLAGELLADSAGVEQLATRMKGLALTGTLIEEAAREILTNPSHAFMGAGDHEAVIQALVRHCSNIQNV